MRALKKAKWDKAAKKRRKHNAAKPQPDVYHEEHEGHENLNKSKRLVFHRALRVLRGEIIFAEMMESGILHCKNLEAYCNGLRLEVEKTRAFAMVSLK